MLVLVLRHNAVEEFTLGGFAGHDWAEVVARGKGVNFQELTVQDVMMRDPVKAHPDTPTLQALEMMREHNIGCLPVVDGEDRLLGAVTVYDLLEVAEKVLEDFLRGEGEDAAPPRKSGRGVPRD